MLLIAAAHLITVTWGLGVWYVDAGFVLLGVLNLLAATVRGASRLRAFCRMANIGVAAGAAVALVAGSASDLVALLFVGSIVTQAALGLKVLARPA